MLVPNALAKVYNSLENKQREGNLLSDIFRSIQEITMQFLTNACLQSVALRPFQFFLRAIYWSIFIILRTRLTEEFQINFRFKLKLYLKFIFTSNGMI
jgi:hypothetical protein